MASVRVPVEQRAQSMNAKIRVSEASILLNFSRFVVVQPSEPREDIGTEQYKIKHKWTSSY